MNRYLKIFQRHNLLLPMPAADAVRAVSEVFDKKTVMRSGGDPLI